MGESDAAEAAIAQITALLAEARDRLTAASIADEPLADYQGRQRRLLVFVRDSRMVQIDRVWRLGVFLLDHDGALFATGETTRAVDPGWPQHQAASAEVRREYRGAAQRGGFPAGQTVNFNAAPIELDAAALAASTGPLFLRDGAPFVRWSHNVGDEGAIPFERYLAERLELLLHPPEGA
ncbi:hypothetical protein SAMN04489806_3075 [Paramicrobacterium humi]|uniref:Uncharacterized protein n=1 Tax=Paramicrobacterium humi TaxID=640635 RepID=A0A1H4T1G6_9MICO|nr:hypothetical protein [Microbacterium humi]SEC50305.1 hypothetical protein SAMN04489806_3075 [Microbacterium humi]